MLTIKKCLPCLKMLAGAGVGLVVGTGVGAIISLAVEETLSLTWMIAPMYISFLLGGSIGCIISAKPSRTQKQREPQPLEVISTMAPGYNISPSALARIGLELPQDENELSLRETVLPLTPSQSSAPLTPTKNKENAPSFTNTNQKGKYLNVPA